MKILILTNFDMGLYKFRKELICELCRENQVIAALPNGEYIEALKDIGLKCINFEFLFTGRIMKDKGIDELLEAMECIYERYKAQQCRHRESKKAFGLCA